MSRLAVVLVVLLVLLAGCGSLSGGEGAPDREPYGVEEPVNASIEDEPEELLPGLTTEGVTNSAELRETHEDVIGNRSYTIETETEYVTEADEGTIREVIETTTYVDPEAGVFYEVQEFTNSDETGGFIGEEQNQTIEQWIGEDTFFRTEYENGTVEYMPTPGADVSPEQRFEQASLRLLTPLQTGETTTAGAVESEEGTYYVVEGQENRSDEAERTVYGEVVEMRTLVREDGLVRQSVGEQVIGEGDDETVVEVTTEITAIGETTVERPDWYEEAIEAQPEEPDMAGPNGGDGPDEQAGNESADGEPPAGSDAEDGDSSG